MYLIFKLNGCQETLSNPLTLALIPARSCSPDSIQWTVDCHEARERRGRVQISNLKRKRERHVIIRMPPPPSPKLASPRQSRGSLAWIQNHTKKFQSLLLYFCWHFMRETLFFWSAVGIPLPDLTIWALISPPSRGGQRARSLKEFAS